MKLFHKIAMSSVAVLGLALAPSSHAATVGIGTAINDILSLCQDTNETACVAVVKELLALDPSLSSQSAFKADSTTIGIGSALKDIMALCKETNETACVAVVNEVLSLDPSVGSN